MKILSASEKMPEFEVAEYGLTASGRFSMVTEKTPKISPTYARHSFFSLAHMNMKHFEPGDALNSDVRLYRRRIEHR